MLEVIPHMAGVVTYSASGFTTLSMARERPSRPILAITLNEIVARRLGLLWGVKAFVNPEVFKNFTGLEETAQAVAKKAKIGKKGEYLVITAGYPIGVKGMTNLIYTTQL
jgi:pyruvate kinase